MWFHLTGRLESPRGHSDPESPPLQEAIGFQHPKRVLLDAGHRAGRGTETWLQRGRSRSRDPGGPSRHRGRQAVLTPPGRPRPSPAGPRTACAALVDGGRRGEPAVLPAPAEAEGTSRDLVGKLRRGEGECRPRGHRRRRLWTWGLSPRQCSVRHRMRGGLRVWGPQVLGEVVIQGQDSGEGPTST